MNCTLRSLLYAPLLENNVKVEEEKCYEHRTLRLPESATMSVELRPLLEKDDSRPLRLNVGGGRLLLAALRLAVVASLLPN